MREQSVSIPDRGDAQEPAGQNVGGSSARADFRKAAFITVGANGLIAALAFCTGSLSARLLGVQGRGELAAIQMWPSAVAGFAALGLPEAGVYFAARDPERYPQATWCPR